MDRKELKQIRQRELAYAKSRLDYFDSLIDDPGDIDDKNRKKPKAEIVQQMKKAYDDLDKKIKEG